MFNNYIIFLNKLYLKLKIVLMLCKLIFISIVLGKRTVQGTGKRVSQSITCYRMEY